jgi:6-phosphogluconolactonase (cycloisomerase 2 family)
MGVGQFFSRCAGIIAGIIAVAACGGGGDGGSAATPPPPAPPTRLVLVANSDSGDNTLSIFTLDVATGALARHAASPFSGGLGLNPASVAVTPSGRFAYVANTGTSDISALAISPATSAIALIAPSPYSVAPKPSPQFVAVDPTGRFAYVALSADWVEAYAINAGTGALTPIVGSAGEAPSTSPRHIAIDPSGRFAYVANGTSNSITVYGIDQTTGALTSPQVLPLMFTPPNAPLPVAIAIDPLGKYAYVANSGTNSVSAFTLDTTTGALTEMAMSPITVPGGPNSVAVEPTGKFAYVANLTGSTISILDIDPNTGLPSANGTVQLTPGSGPRSVAVDPSGVFLFVTLSVTNQVEGFRINSTDGTLTRLLGSPFETGLSPLGVIATGPIQ